MDEAKIVPPATRFRINVQGLCNFIKELLDGCYNKGYTQINPFLVDLAATVLTAYSDDDIIKGFIEGSHTHWDMIKNRDEQFFSAHARCVFAGLPADRIDAFKILFETRDEKGNSVINQEDRNVLWTFFDTFVKIAIKYIHEERQPRAIRHVDHGRSEYNRTGNELQPVYTKQALPEVDMTHHSRNWGLSLTFPVPRN